MILRAVLVLAALLMEVTVASAAGAFFPRSEAAVSVSDPVAILVWDGKVETLILAPTVQSKDPEALLQLAWLLPVPSATKPEVRPAVLTPFHRLAYFQRSPTEHREPEMGGALPPVVRTLEKSRTAGHQRSVLEVTAADGLKRWLWEGRYPLTGLAEPVLETCVTKGTKWFVGDRIDLLADPADPFGGKAKKPDQLERVKEGLIVPLILRFEPTEPVYPLRLSSLHPRTGDLQIFFLASFPAAEKGGRLTAAAPRPVPHRVRKMLLPSLELAAGTVLTHFTGSFEKLSLDDLTFGPAKSAEPSRAAPPEAMDQPGDAEFAAIFAGISPDEEKAIAARKRRDEILLAMSPGSPLSNEEKAKELRTEEFDHLRKADHLLAEQGVAFARSHPASRFADDAIALAAVRISDANPVARREELARDARAIWTALDPKSIHLESFTRREAPELFEAAHFEDSGLLAPFVASQLAWAHHNRRDDEGKKIAGEMAQEVLKILDSPEHAERVSGDPALKSLRSSLSRLRPDQISAKDLIRKAVAAFRSGDAAGAEVFAKQAVDLRPDVPERPTGMMGDGPDAAWYLLALTRGEQGKHVEAREAFEKLAGLPEDYFAFIPLDPAGVGSAHLTLSLHGVRHGLAVCHLKQGEHAAGLELALSAIEGLEKHLPGDKYDLGMAHYTAACGRILTGDQPGALEHIAKSVEYMPALRTPIAADPDFAPLAADPEFLKLVR